MVRFDIVRMPSVAVVTEHLFAQVLEILRPLKTKEYSSSPTDVCVQRTLDLTPMSHKIIAF
jgi:hypothetical protein